MFQYAAARSVAERRGVPVALDVRSFPYDIFDRRYALSRFRLRESAVLIGDPGAAPRLKSSRRLRAVAWRVRGKVAPRLGRRAIVERSFAFDPRVRDAPDGAVLMGTFQSWRYFDDAQAAVREAFAHVDRPSAPNADLLAEILRTDAVCAHFRVHHSDGNRAGTNRILGMLPLTYYESALGVIASRAAAPRLFVFADDIAWVREHVRFPLPAVFVDQNAATDGAEDLRLMTACRHFIVPNSSLSWWAAWLSERADKVVVAPRDWFAGRDWPTADLVPPSWIRL